MAITNKNELIALILKTQADFFRLLSKDSPKINHYVGDKNYQYLKRMVKFRIVYKQRYCEGNISLHVRSIASDRNLKATSFHGYSEYYGSDVYVTCEKFLYDEVEILSIEPE